MDEGLGSPNREAALNQQEEKEGHEEESTEQSSRRKSPASSRRRMYRKRSPASQSPEGSPKRRSLDFSPSSSKRSRDSDHRENDSKHGRRSRSRSPRRRRRSPSPRRLFHMTDIGPEVSGHLTALLWKVEKLLQNQERMLKNQERLLQLMERHSVSTSGSSIGGEERFVNGLEQLSPALQEHNVSTVESSCLSVANSAAPNGFTGSHCTTFNPVPSDCKLVETDACRIATRLSLTTEANGSQHDQQRSPAHGSENHQSATPVHSDSGVEGLKSEPVESTLLRQKAAIPLSHASESNGLQKNSSASLNNGKSPQIAVPFEIAPWVVALNSDTGNSAEGHEQVKCEQERLKELFNLAEKIQKTSCSIGNFSVNLVKVLFSKDEIHNRNCSGTRGKTALNKEKLDLVKFCAFKLYSVPQTEQELLWKQKCVVSIDEYLRRGNRTRALSKGKEAIVPSPLSTPNVEHSHGNSSVDTKTSLGLES